MKISRPPGSSASIRRATSRSCFSSKALFLSDQKRSCPFVVHRSKSGEPKVDAHASPSTSTIRRVCVPAPPRANFAAANAATIPITGTW